MKSKPKLKQVAKSFKATLEPIPSNLGWVIIRIPFNVPKVWGTRAMVRVKGEINGFPFRASVFPTREGYHGMIVKKSMQTGANVRVGDTAHFRIEPDPAKPVTSVPPELQRILNEDRAFRRWFDQLSLSMRRWICYWIIQVKSPEARVRRAEQAAEQLMATMEAELDLPPILKRTFAADPRAYQGWQSMTPLRRRGWLLSIFSCRTPESRERRIAKMLQEALARLEGKPKTKAAREEAAHEELE
ncbi:MAG TPA: YdeI/OmpD-associated family protein [Candidatus Acidoferrum sp.]|nr:YdeI/OmpD-associated family protein [Candidatus Acidoferrum sp.]